MQYSHAGGTLCVVLTDEWWLCVQRIHRELMHQQAQLWAQQVETLRTLMQKLQCWWELSCKHAAVQGLQAYAR